MPRIKKQVIIGAPIATVYGVVANVHRYPDFVPGVESVDVRDDIVKMRGRLGPLTLTLITRVRFVSDKSIELLLVDGPFKAMNGRWDFEATPEGTRVTYSADFELGTAFRLPGIRSMLESAFRAQVEQIVESFQHRILNVHRQALSAQGQL